MVQTLETRAASFGRSIAVPVVEGLNHIIDQNLSCIGFSS
jgi:hypothetical protein